MNTIVIGLGFGDEGKGSIVDAIAQRTPDNVIVKYGGCQAAHHVVLADGRSHCFAQFGSGTLTGSTTFLSRHMIVDPLAMANEASHLRSFGIDPYERLYIDREARMVTPYHAAMNRIREQARGAHRHGSCGMGIGEMVKDQHEGLMVTVGDMHDNFPRFVRMLRRIQERKLDDPLIASQTIDPYSPLYEEPEDCARRMVMAVILPARAFGHAVVGRRFLDSIRDRPLIFEGSQGVLLDQEHGLGAPDHVTWTDTTLTYPWQLLADIDRDAYSLGVMRTFMTRHGAGPFPTEDPRLLPLVEHDHNQTGEWQGPLRVGRFDGASLAYAIKHAPVNGIALTHLDKVQNVPADAFKNMVESRLRKPVVIESYGQTAADKQMTKPFSFTSYVRV